MGAAVPFDQARHYLGRFEKVDITETMLRETAEAYGASFCAADEYRSKEFGTVSAEKTEILYVQADGGMVPIRGKTPENRLKTEYKEVKVGVVFRTEDIIRRKSAKGKEICRITKKRFATSIGKGVEHFAQLLKRVAAEAGSMRAQTIVFISDGADWLDHMRERLFPRSVHILDWYHASEHLWNCGKAIFGENETASVREWVEPLREMLWNGMAEAVCERLLFEAKRRPRVQTPIIELHNYYKSRLDKMRYPHFRRMGFFIGSGAVESAHKYLVQSRLKQAGMKWTIDGASAIIRLRQMLYDGSWDQQWGRSAA